MIIKSTELTGRISNHVVVLSIGVSGGTLQIRSTSSACICALMFSIGTAPSLTGWLCPHVSFVCAHLCLSTHAYVPAYVSSFLIVFTHMPLSSSGRKARRLDVMYVERWSRSLCALGDAARTSPCGCFPFWGPVGGTPRKNTDICIHCSQTYKAQQLRTGLPVIMSHTHTHTHAHTHTQTEQHQHRCPAVTHTKGNVLTFLWHYVRAECIRMWNTSSSRITTPPCCGHLELLAHSLKEKTYWVLKSCCSIDVLKMRKREKRGEKR